jgi:spore coat protein A, manganese oxidase
MDRRRFLQIIGAAGAVAAIPWRFDWQRGLQWASAEAFMISPPLTMFTEPLRGVTGPTGIPVAAADAAAAEVTGVKHYTILIKEFTDQLHATFAANRTRLWGFHPDNVLVGSPTPRHLGGIILAKKGEPIQITFKNQLPTVKPAVLDPQLGLIPVDTTLPGANQAQNRIAVHVHGGHIPWISDGGPFDWFDPLGNHGLSFLNNQTLRSTAAAAGDAEYYYNMDQSARLVWYHDHAHGITRINAYAGVATALIIRDAFEANLVAPPLPPAKPFGGLPGYIENGGLELPIVIQDKVFVNNAAIPTLDPGWPLVAPARVQGNGSLWYAHTYDPKLYKLLKGGRTKPLPLPDPSVVPEFFGDSMLVNGTAYPTVTVQPRRYRFRILNACNARFLNLQLFQATAATPDGITLNNKGVPANLPYIWNGVEPVVNGTGLQARTPDQLVKTGTASKCLVIGNEGGFLHRPVAMPLNLPFNPVTLTGSLIMGPAERLDVLIDFSGYPQGTQLILYNDAPAPFPVGAPINDFLPNGTGSGPNTREIMKFIVGAAAADVTISLPANFAAAPAVPLPPPSTASDAWNDPLIFPNYNAAGFPIETTSYPSRQLTLNEDFDAEGRLIQLLGTNIPLVPGKFGRAYLDLPVTENPANGTTEIWEIANLTGDTHPIHFHLVNCQVLSRRAFNVGKYAGIPAYLAAARPPDPDERGWKETVRMHPGDVTRVVMKFQLAPILTSAGATVPTPVSPRTGGHEFVWHCHILEHEEHDMMRPLVVSP